MKTLSYKGYLTNVCYDAEGENFRGKIEGIRDFIDFQSDHIEGVEKEFYQAVDDYLAFCEDVGKEPEKADCVKGSKSS